ncbi:MerR family transcriptional regulator [Mesobacillus subterraneus]|uniref:Chromosome-anchoring protein RacA n=1 Tax=Mesobacillus subterraneus TaxID=285983 RepID=A0A427TMA5_9BACI|nr:MerR family transcriptional regulator [Mesobacillus subterraneus]RSD25467.1 MerR family transcriptional regulator [Mesobacillus subterraneus]
MNTNAVAKLLGVSPSTIQRWVKQANLQMERTELGHYQYSDESIGILRDIQEQLNNGILLQDLKIKGRKTRKATATTVVPDGTLDKISSRLDEMEKKLAGKADEVVSYQLLQHRREIEDLQNEITRLNEIISSMQEAAAQKEKELIKKDEPSLPAVASLRKFKKRNMISSFFGF